MKKTPYEITKKEIGHWPNPTCPSIDDVIDELRYHEGLLEGLLQKRNVKLMSKLERLRSDNENLRIKLEEWRDAYKTLSDKYCALEKEYNLKFKA